MAVRPDSYAPPPMQPWVRSMERDVDDAVASFQRSINTMLNNNKAIASSTNLLGAQVSRMPYFQTGFGGTVNFGLTGSGYSQTLTITVPDGAAGKSWLNFNIVLNASVNTNTANGNMVGSVNITSGPWSSPAIPYTASVASTNDLPAAVGTRYLALPYAFNIAYPFVGGEVFTVDLALFGVPAANFPTNVANQRSFAWTAAYYNN